MMKSIKKIFVLILATMLLTSCTVNEVSFISSSTSTYSSETSEPILSEQEKNHSEEFKELYKQYENQYDEKLSVLDILFTTKNSVKTSDIPVTLEKKEFTYQSLPATIEKIFNAKDGTIYQYVITITDTKSITKYIYYFDENTFTYCEKIDLFYFTEKKGIDELLHSKVYFYVQKQDTDETFLMIDSIQICVPIEKKEIFTLDKMNDFFETPIGDLPNDEIILQNRLEEILGGLEYLGIDDIAKNQEIYKEYIAQIDTMFKTLETEYASSYKKQKKFSLESDQNRNYVYASDGFFDGRYLTRIENDAETIRHYMSQTSAYGGEMYVPSYAVSKAILYDERIFVAYADRDWMHSNEKVITSYSVDSNIFDSEKNIDYHVIPELEIIYTYGSSGDVFTFSEINEAYDSYIYIVE